MCRSILSPRTRKSAFTLIEVLVVMAILLVLMAATIKIMDGVKQRAYRVKTEGNLNLVSSALTAYRGDFGDYPWVQEGKEEVNLYRSLIGNRSAQGAKSIALKEGKTALVPVTDPFEAKAGKGYIDLGALAIGSINKTPDENDQGEPAVPNLPITRDNVPDHVFIDSWGAPMTYRYKRISDAGKSWKASKYLLFSRGRNVDQKGVPADGILDATWRDSEEAADNIYAP